MELRMKTGFAIVLFLIFLACIICSTGASVVGAVELPSTPTPAPTMRVCLPDRPTPTLAPYPSPTPVAKVYFPLVSHETDKVISYLPPLPTPAPTMNPFPCGGN